MYWSDSFSGRYLQIKLLFKLLTSISLKAMESKTKRLNQKIINTSIKESQLEIQSV